MPSGMDTAAIGSILDTVNHQGGASVAPGGSVNNARLMTVNGSSTANGTELATSGGYTAGGQAMAMGAAAAYSAGARVASNSGTVSWANMPAATEVGTEHWDTGGTPKRWWWGSLTSNLTTNAGDTLSFAPGAVTQTFTG